VCLAFLTGNKAVVMPNPLMEEERFVRGAALKLDRCKCPQALISG